jgi:polyisoprenoid-binding protein YceI
VNSTTLTEARTAIPTGTWRSDPVHSSVGFSVRYALVGTFRGSFGDFSVALETEDGEPRLAGTVKVASVRVPDENLTGHLLSPDFFDAERHPELRFDSTRVRTEGDELVVDGELTIKGVTRPVEARGAIAGPVEHFAGGERLGVELSTVVDRTEFGLDWNAPMPRGGVAVQNDVTLHVDLQLVREEA